MMIAQQTPDDATEKPDPKAKSLVLLFLGGLLIGLATSLPLAVVWPAAMHPPLPVGICLFGTEANPMERIWVKGTIIPLPCTPTFLFIQPAVLVSFLGAGCLFGFIAYELSRRGSRWRLAALGGPSLLLLSYVGMFLVPRIRGPEPPPPFSSGVAEPFAVMIFGISLLFALALGLALRTPGFVWRGFVAAALTGLCYWLVVWFLLGHAVMLWTHDSTTPPLAHSLPVMDNGMGPMMITIMISNLTSGTIGGAITLALLTVSRSKK